MGGRTFHISCRDRLIDSAIQEEAPVPVADKVALKDALVAAMIQLSTPIDKTIRAQIAESISLIASADFPEQWPNLIDVCPTVITLKLALTPMDCPRN
jgi:hypothetical protein